MTRSPALTPAAAAFIGLAAPLWITGPAPGAELSPEWYVVELGTGVTPTFDFGPDGSVHVLWFTFEGNDNGPMTYARAPTLAGPYATQVLATGYFYGPGDLTVARDGAAHVVWHDHFGDPRHLVMAAGRPVAEHPLFTSGPHDGWDASLAFDGRGRLHLSCTDPVLHGSKDSLEYGLFDGATWSFAKVAGSTPFIYGLTTSIAVDSDDEPHVAFCTADDRVEEGDLVYGVQRAGQWTFAPVTNGGPSGRFPALALDAADRPHLAWMDLDPADTSHAFVRYATLEGADWAVRTIDELAHVRFEFCDSRKPLTMALDRQGRPHLAYSDARRLEHAVLEGSDWRRTTVLASATDLLRGVAVLRLDAADVPAIATWEQNEREPQGRAYLLGKREAPAPRFHRADPDESSATDISDAVFIFSYLFTGGRSPRCLETTDANNSGRVDISDGITILQFLFNGAEAPASPGPGSAPCGPDPDAPGTERDLGCAAYEGC